MASFQPRLIMMTALLLGACSTAATWERPHTTAQQRAADEAGCAQGPIQDVPEARPIRSATQEDRVRNEDTVTARDRRDEPQRVNRTAPDRQQVETCMSGLGYQLVRAGESPAEKR